MALILLFVTVILALPDVATLPVVLVTIFPQLELIVTPDVIPVVCWTESLETLIESLWILANCILIWDDKGMVWLYYIPIKK